MPEETPQTTDPTTTIQLSTPPVKEGWKTSEFWQSLAITVVGLGLVVYGIVADKSSALDIGAMMTGLSAGGYALSRALVKKV